MGHLCAPSRFALAPTGLEVCYDDNDDDDNDNNNNNNNNKFQLAMKAKDRGIEVQL